MPNAMIDSPAAPAAEAVAHFAAGFRFETDCWDVHDALSHPDPGFVLLDVRGPALFAKGHVPGAISLPHGKIIASKMAAWPANTLFVTYCAGPHCDGAARGALRRAAAGAARSAGQDHGGRHHRLAGRRFRARARMTICCGLRHMKMEEDMALELRPNCEFCDRDLRPDATNARICTYECPFYADCVDTGLFNVCPNCGGGFTPRPIRPATEWWPGLSVAKRPRSTQRRSLQFALDDIRHLSARVRHIPPESR